MTSRGADKSRLPALGARGQGWVVLQGLLVAAVAAGALLGPRWGAPATVPRLALGGAMAAAGLTLMAVAMRQLGGGFTPNPRPREGAVLRQDSVFALVRHPIYGGIMLSSTGFALVLSPLALVPAVLLAGLLALKAAREERWLREQFPGYAEYRRRVRRRFLPGLL